MTLPEKKITWPEGNLQENKRNEIRNEIASEKVGANSTQRDV